MPPSRRLLTSLLLTADLLAACATTRAANEFAFFHENVLGTSLELRIAADDLERAQWAEARVLAEIDRLAGIYSTYDAASEFRTWFDSPATPRPVSAELLAMLDLCDRWRDRTGGAFDPRAEAYSRLWADAERRGRLPPAAERKGLRKHLEQPSWRLDPAAHTAQRLSDCPLSLNAIAKGEILERASTMAIAPAQGVRGVMINLGGDLRIRGDIVRRLGIVSPRADSESSPPLTFVQVRDCAVATSGASQRGFEIEGQWFSHVLDPRTGMPVERVLGATVIAPRAADADVLATVCNVLEPEESLRLVRSVPGAECLIVCKDGRLVRSTGWSRLEDPGAGVVAMAPVNGSSLEGLPPNAASGSTPTASDAPAAAWNREFELVVNFEINAPEGEGRRFRRPYVAVWVENQDGYPVRNLVLWVSMGGAGPFQWLPDLKRWYRADQVRKQAENKDLFFTIARPTRQPGKYKAVWDGKDQNGTALPPGEYTILIDAAREHGTYQNMRKKVVLSDKPFTEELKGGVEIKGASLEYRRKAAAKPSE